MPVQNKVSATTLISYDVSAFDGAYHLMTAAGGTLDPLQILQYVNDTDRDVTISYDGTNDHDFIRLGTDRQYGFATNSIPQTSICVLAKGTKVYVKGTAGGTGLFYLVGYYNPQGV